MGNSAGLLFDVYSALAEDEYSCDQLSLRQCHDSESHVYRLTYAPALVAVKM